LQSNIVKEQCSLKDTLFEYQRYQHTLIKIYFYILIAKPSKLSSSFFKMYDLTSTTTQIKGLNDTEVNTIVMQGLK